jgi:drug/metabolite transporter (DMT)-like permease
LNRLIAGGVANGVGLLFLQAAIAYREVTVAASLSTTVPLWTLVLGQLLLRNSKIGPWHIGAGVLTAAGAVILITR